MLEFLTTFVVVNNVGILLRVMGEGDELWVVGGCMCRGVVDQCFVGFLERT